MFEVEMKAKVDNPKELLKKISSFATFKKEIIKNDFYYRLSTSDNPHSSFRLREMNGEHWVTLKEREWEGSCEVNHEIEFLVGDGLAFKQFAQALGYEVSFTKKKHSIVYFADGVSYEMNEVEGLGWFLELEALTPAKSQSTKLKQQLLQIYERLGISGDQIVNKSYAELLKEHQGQ